MPEVKVVKNFFKVILKLLKIEGKSKSEDLEDLEDLKKSVEENKNEKRIPLDEVIEKYFIK